MKKCEFCGAEYTPNTSSQRYCCRECNREADKKNKRERYAEKHHIGEPRVCVICGREFIAKSAKGETCSKKCGTMLSNIRNGYCQYDFLFSSPQKKECPTCGKVFSTTNPRKRYCSDECKQRSHDHRINNDNRIDRDITLKKLFDRDGGTCKICGGECDFGDYKIKRGKFSAGINYPTIDHIYPLSKGGQHSWKNVQLAHFRCNCKKGNTTA